MLVLASQSPARRRLLARLGVKFEVRPAHLDEAAVQKRIRDPRRLVAALSRLKAEAIAGEFAPGTFVIGSDQTLVCDGRIYGKPGTVARAEKQLARFSGRTIELLTGVCVAQVGPKGRLTKTRSAVQRTRMTFRKLSSAEIREYVRLDHPVDCAGSFKFEERGARLIAAVRTDDPTAIEGLPLLRVAGWLREAGLF